jgi:hypothetical protein
MSLMRLPRHGTSTAALLAPSATTGPAAATRSLPPACQMIRSGTAEHARTLHEAALALYRSKLLERVEADVAVPVDVYPVITAVRVRPHMSFSVRPEV